MANRDPLASIGQPLLVPQTQPIPGREADMQPNNAGGYTFTKDMWRRLEDFMILGTAGGTYYVAERDHTIANYDIVLKAVAEDGARAANLAGAMLIGKPSVAPRPNGPLFVLAAAHVKGDAAARSAVLMMAPEVVRTSFHRSMLWGYIKQLAGLRRKNGTLTIPSSPATRRLWHALMLVPAVDDLAFSILKGRSRKTPDGEDVSAVDILRKFHPNTTDPARRALFGYVTGDGDNYPVSKVAELVPVVGEFTEAQALTTVRDAVAFVTEHPRTPWEFLPDGLRTKETWERLAATTGMTAVLRNLGLMTRLGAIAPLSDTAQVVAERITNPKAVRNARIHPVDVWLTTQAYGAGIQPGRGGKPDQTWTPNPQVMQALDMTFEMSFGNVTPCGKRLLIAVDCSGSMDWDMHLPNGTPIGRVFTVANVMASILMRTEPNTHLIEVGTAVHPGRVTGATSLADIRKLTSRREGTNLALPFLWAARERVMADGIIVLTDDETWAGGWGSGHASQALEVYRQTINPDARVVVASMTAAGHGIADPQDAGVLNIAGLDASLPQLVSGFIG